MLLIHTELTNIYLHIIHDAYSQRKKLQTYSIEIQIPKQQYAPKEVTESESISSTFLTLCVIINLVGIYCQPQKKGLKLTIPPMKGQLLGGWFLWVSRTLTRGSQCWQMRRLIQDQSGGNPAGHLEMLELTCLRTSRRPNRTNSSQGHRLSVWTTKILRCHTWDFSSSVELSAAVLKQTPQQEGWRPYPFLKQARGDLDDINNWSMT